MTEFERYCVDIYMRYHVTQLRSLSEMQQAWWKLGQSIYSLQVQANERVAFLNQE